MNNREFEQEIELAKMMVADMNRTYRKYAKAALKAAQERAEKIRDEKYHGCANVAELQDLYGYAGITLEEYDAGRDFFESQQARAGQQSLIEKHRQNLKDIRDRWKGTINELQQELDELNGVQKDTRTWLEKLEYEERRERYASKL